MSTPSTPSTSSTQSTWSTVLLDLIFLIALIAAAIHVGRGLELFKDLEMPDESNYLHLGRHFFSALRPPADTAPLYSLWYNGLSFIRRDPIDLFYLNARLTAALPALFLFLLLRARRLSSEAAAFVSFLFLISPANLQVWPRVSHFALCLLLGGFAIEGRMASPVRKSLVLALAALLASYCRPEFYLAFLGLIAICLFQAFYCRRSFPLRREWVPLAAFALAAGGLHAFFGMPMFHGEGRSFFAFGQHYALNYVERTKAGLSPWYDWPQVIAREFGPGVHGIGQALAARPDLFRLHFSANLDRFFPSFWECLGKLALPVRPAFLQLSWELVLCGATILGYILFAARWTGITLPSAGAALRRWFSPGELARILAVIAPSLAACLVIFPRWHYLLPLAAAPLAAGAVLCSHLARIPQSSLTHDSQLTTHNPDHKSPWSHLFLALLIILAILPLTPTALNYSRDSMERVTSIRLIRTLKVRGEVNLLEAEGCYAAYLDWHYRTILFYNKAEPFNDYRAKNNLGMIKTDPQIIWDPRFRDDPQWRAFLKDPAAAGFVTLPIFDTGKALLVRADLLK